MSESDEPKYYNSLYEALRRGLSEESQKVDKEIEESSSPDISFKEDNEKVVSSSRTGLIVFWHFLIKCMMAFLMFCVATSITFTIYVMGKMIYTYVNTVLSTPADLKALLSHIWTILSGAFVLAFFQIAMKVASNLKDDK